MSLCVLIPLHSLRNLWLAGPALAAFVSALPVLPRLTHLVVPYIADDALVAAVGACCPQVMSDTLVRTFTRVGQLELLDLSGTRLVTDRGVAGLYRVERWGERGPAQLTSSLHTLLLGGPGGTRLGHQVPPQPAHSTLQYCFLVSG